MVSRFVRKVRTASGAVAVQVVTRRGRQVEGIEHVGSAHSDAALALLLVAARERLAAGQEVLDLGEIAEIPPQMAEVADWTAPRELPLQAGGRPVSVAAGGRVVATSADLMPVGQFPDRGPIDPPVFPDLLEQLHSRPRHSRTSAPATSTQRSEPWVGPELVTTRRPPAGAITTQAGPEFVQTSGPAGARSGDHTHARSSRRPAASASHCSLVQLGKRSVSRPAANAIVDGVSSIARYRAMKPSAPLWPAPLPRSSALPDSRVPAVIAGIATRLGVSNASPRALGVVLPFGAGPRDPVVGDLDLQHEPAPLVCGRELPADGKVALLVASTDIRPNVELGPDKAPARNAPLPFLTGFQQFAELRPQFGHVNGLAGQFRE